MIIKISEITKEIKISFLKIFIFSIINKKSYFKKITVIKKMNRDIKI